MEFRVDCNKCRGTADRRISHTERNPDRVFWKCPNTDCNFFVWENELKAAQKISIEEDRTVDPGSSQPQTGYGASSQKRYRSPEPPYRGEDTSAGAFKSLQSEGTPQTKAPKFSHDSDVHSESQRALANGFLTPPSTFPGNAAIYTQPPATPESPSRKGKERGEYTAPMSQATISGSSQSIKIPFEDQIDILKGVLDTLKEDFQRSERRRIAAERSAEMKMKRIKELEAQVEEMSAKFKMIGDAMRPSK